MSQSSPSSPKQLPNPEVSDRPRRRKFSAEYKLAILRELDACTQPGQAAGILRREGLYSSNISEWRRKRAAGEFAALASKKRGRKPVSRSPEAAELRKLRRENAKLRSDLYKANMIIDVQKKLSEALGLELATLDDSEE